MRERLLGWARRFGWDALGCCLGLLYGLPTLIYPFGADQGIHWYVGFGWLHGHMPYATGISGKPPGIFAVHAVASALLGPSQAAIRAFELLSMPVLGYVVARAACTRSSTPLRPGLWGAAACLCSVVNFTYADYWNTAHPELWETIALLAAFAVAVHGDHARRRACITGALCMVAFVLKYPAAVVAIPIAAVCGWRAWWEQPERRWRAFFEAALLFVLGAAVVGALTVLPFVVTGTFDAMVEVCVDMTQRYVDSAKPKSDWWPGFWKPSRASLLMWAGACAASGVLWAVRARDRKLALRGGLLLVLLLSAVGGVVLQGRNFTYHWVSVFPFLVTIALWGVHWTWSRPPLLLGFALITAMAAFAIAPRFISHRPTSYRAHAARWLDYAGGRVSAEELQREFSRRGRFEHYAAQQHVGLVAKQHAKPGDMLCARGFLSPIYQVSGMRCSSRHAVQAFVGLGGAAWMQEYARDLRARPPRFIVTFEDRAGDIRGLIRAGYVELLRDDGLVLLRRS